MLGRKFSSIRELQGRRADCQKNLTLGASPVYMTSRTHRRLVVKDYRRLSVFAEAVRPGRHQIPNRRSACSGSWHARRCIVAPVPAQATDRALLLPGPEAAAGRIPGFGKPRHDFQPDIFPLSTADGSHCGPSTDQARHTHANERRRACLGVPATSSRHLQLALKLGREQEVTSFARDDPSTQIFVGQHGKRERRREAAAGGDL